jgi:ferrous iron transport protein B
VASNFFDPLGFRTSLGEVETIESAAQAQEVHVGTFGAMVGRFDSRIGAFAYLLFVLLYAPCVAATAAIYRETNLGWTLFVALWSTGIAYLAAALFY